MPTNQEIFNKLNKLNLNDKVKEKIGLKYLSWAYAWGELKTAYPDASMKIYTRSVTTTQTRTVKDNNGEEVVTTTSYTNEVPYFTDGKTCFVKVGVIIGDLEQFEIYPVMDNKNNAVSLSTVTMTAVNKAIQRAFVKACARHGLGLYIYANEDLPDAERRTIDFKAITDISEKCPVVVLSAEGFEQMKNEVITGLQAKYPEDVAQAILGYASAKANGKRISLFDVENDSATLQRIYTFIKETCKQLAAPVNG